MKERLKKLRKELSLTQQEFADRIGISRGNIATYETREGNPGSSVIALICREFSVNETWLRTGEGEMFIQKSRDEQISVFVSEVLQEDSDFRRQLISLLARMTTDEWKMLEAKMKEIAVALLATDSLEQEAEAVGTAVGAAARDQYLLEKKAEAESSASPSDTGSKKRA